MVGDAGKNRGRQVGQEDTSAPANRTPFAKSLVSSAVCASLAVLTGCSSFGMGSASRGESVDANPDRWIASGSLALFRAAPKELSVHDSIALSIERGAHVLGFGPLPIRRLVTKAELQPSYALFIKRSEGVIGLVEDGSVTKLIECEGSTLLPPGEYTVEHKQERPVWYAPDEYFSSRGIDVPVEGGKDRFLKGAYGSHALFLSSSFALHSAPMWSSEVGGLRLPETELQELFSSLPLGTPVRVIE